MYIGRVNRKKKYLQKQYLFWRVTEVLDFFNGDPVLHSECLNSEFCKNCIISQVYFFLKTHKEIKLNHDIPHDTCAYEVCKNITLITRGLNPKLVEKLPGDPDKVIDKFAGRQKKMH